MIKSVKMQFKLMISKLSFKFAFSLVLLYSLLCFVINVKQNMNVDISVMLCSNALYCGNDWSKYWGIFSKTFPFLVVFPFAFSFIDDLNIKINSYIINRMGKRNYYISKMVNCFIGGFIIIFIPFLINIILCHITFPHNNNTYLGAYNLTNYIRSLTGSNISMNTDYKELPFLSIYLISPLLYNVLYDFLLSCFCGILGMLSLAFSFFIKKFKLLLFIPIYLLFYFTTLMSQYSYENTVYSYSKKYANYDLMDYVSVHSFYGKSPLFFTLLVVLILLFCSLSIFSMRKKDIL